MNVVTAILAVALAFPPLANASLPGPVSDEVQSDRPLRPSYQGQQGCGTGDSRLWLNANCDGGFCDLVLQRVGEDGSTIAVATRRASSRGGGAYLVCDDSGAGVVLFGDGYVCDSDCRVPAWKLQWFDSAGSWIDEPRPLDASSLCNYPELLSLDAAGDIVAFEACRLTESTVVAMMRRFPAGGGIEPQPVPLSDPTSDGIHQFGSVSDALGNTLVAWTEAFGDVGDGNPHTRIVARALGPDLELLGLPFRVDTFDPARAWLGDVVAVDDGIFSIYWDNRLEGGTIARTISIDTNRFPFVTTTTTTLPPSAEAPRFDRVRTVGRTSPLLETSVVSEGSLVSMNGDGNGALMLRRWMNPNSYFDEALPRTTAYATGDGGVRWSRIQTPPPISLFYDQPAWDAVSPSGTLLMAELVTEQASDEAYSWYRSRLVSRRSIDDGKTWSEPVTIRPIPGGDDFFFHDAALATDGHGDWLAASLWSEKTGVYQTWRTRLNVSFSHDDGRTWIDAAGAWESVTWVECCGEAAKVNHLVTASAGVDGSWGLTWRSEKLGTVWTARAADTTSAWEVTQLRAPYEKPPEIDLGDWYDYAAPYSRPAFAITPAGVRVVAWEEKHAPQPYGADGDIFFARSADDGLTWGEPAPLNAYASIDGARDLEPSLAADSKGRILAAWASHDSLGGSIGMDSDIVSSLSIDGGESWSPPAAVDAAAAGDDRQDLGPLVAAVGDNRWTVAWTTQPYSARWFWDQDDAIVKVAVAGSTCGDAVVDPGEDCDDGNEIDGDGCNSNCTLAGCGNELLDDGETCERDDPFTGVGCTARCEYAACGDGVRDIWSEQCDDGNSADDDECPTTCRRAVCGDGYVDRSEDSREECDDANSSDLDGCTSSCRDAFCGDGIVRDGVEECDDWDIWGGDACTDLCMPAVCGDGRLWVGVEQCDDPTGEIYHGNCTADCKFIEACSDADANGTVTAGDALTILRDAVDLGDVCTPDRCDVNGSGHTTAIDASATLRNAAGLSVELNCPMQGTAGFFLDESPLLGALQFEVDYSGASTGFGKGDGKAACETSLQGVLFVDALRPPGVLVMGFLTSSGFRGPVELARCFVYARRGDPAATSGIRIDVVDVTDPSGDPIDPPPQIRLVTH